MSTSKVTKKHLDLIYKDSEIVALHARLLKCVMDWMHERGQDPKPLTYAEQEMGDIALTLIDQVKLLIAKTEEADKKQIN